ncbi:hypothetical protein ACFYZB_26630 [Streptomyces sp. NPDC001852]|uniref:hypothetical protein n=1 Tax=Streptomyces sp. NPDC001852 TaxID=3364619 RepID=UPI0036956281
MIPSAADEFALRRWAAHGYETDPASLGDTGYWTQPDERDLTAEEQPGLGRAMLLHGMHRARAAGATRATVACLGARGYPKARGLFHGVGFREPSRDAPLVKSSDTPLTSRPERGGTILIYDSACHALDSA